MRPLGFEADKITIRDREAAFIREAATAVTAGTSLRELARRANEDPQIRTVAGGRWAPVTIKRVLTSPRTAGLTADGSPAPWPAILDRSVWERVRHDLDARSNGTAGQAQSDRRTYLLTGGLALCALCGRPLIPRPSNSGRRGYVCRSGPPSEGCGKIRVAADGLEDFVAVHVLGRLSVGKTAEQLRRLVRTDRAHLAELVARDEQWLRQLGEDYADNQIAREAFLAGQARVKHRLRMNRAELDRAEQAADLPIYGGVDLAVWWAEASVERRRSLVHVMLEAVLVGPSRKRGTRVFEEDRVSLRWR